jgi:hypothetical protein
MPSLWQFPETDPSPGFGSIDKPVLSGPPLSMHQSQVSMDGPSAYQTAQSQEEAAAVVGMDLDFPIGIGDRSGLV